MPFQFEGESSTIENNTPYDRAIRPLQGNLSPVKNTGAISIKPLVPLQVLVFRPVAESGRPHLKALSL
jgi:hypothetical protein